MQHNLELPFDEFVMIGSHPATVIRSSRRRTIEVQVRDGELLVRAPASMPRVLLESELRNSEDWVARKLADSRKRPGPVARGFVSGETIPWLGQELRLDVRTGSRSCTALKDDVLAVTLSSRVRQRREYTRNAIIRWMHGAGREHIEERATYFAPMLGVRWSEIRIRSFRSMWGSCSSRGRLDFNWRILLAPASVADYVVVHELAHRKEFNHSARFWEIVESVIPDYRQHRDWLHHNSALLNL